MFAVFNRPTLSHAARARHLKKNARFSGILAVVCFLLHLYVDSKHSEYSAACDNYKDSVGNCAFVPKEIAIFFNEDDYHSFWALAPILIAFFSSIMFINICLVSARESRLADQERRAEEKSGSSGPAVNRSPEFGLGLRGVAAV